MNIKLKVSADGSHTLYNGDLDENYHSVHGAIHEALHVFIKHGLKALGSSSPVVRIFEMGFGTGLNAFVTLLEAERQQQQISYHSIESRPLSSEVIHQLNYTEILKSSEQQFRKLHECRWNVSEQISDNFTLTKIKGELEQLELGNRYHLIYYDAFGPRVQPELWTQAIFQKMFDMLDHNGLLVTYSAKGSVKRAMKNVGFAVETLEGPPGKREMTRAVKR